MQIVRNSHINAAVARVGSPLRAAECATRADLGAPENVAVIWIQCPKDPTLLAGPNNVTSLILDVREQAGAAGKIVVGTRRYGAVWVWLAQTGTSPGIELLNLRRPLDRTGLQIQGDDGIKVVWRPRWDTSRLRWLLFLAGLHMRWDTVVVACRNYQRVSADVHRWLTPDRPSAVAAGLAAIVRHHVGLPKDAPGVLVKSDDASAEHAASVIGVCGSALFAGGNPHINHIAVHDR